MHDVLVAVAFMAMVLAPCVVALQSGMHEDEGRGLSEEDIAGMKADRAFVPR